MIASKKDRDWKQGEKHRNSSRKSETLLKRSTNTELAQIDKIPSIIIPKEVGDEREEAD